MNKYLKIAIQVGSVLLIGVLSIWLTSFVSNRFSKDEKTKEEIIKEVVKEIIIRRPTCASTLESFAELKKSGQTVTVVNDLSSYAESGMFVKSKTVAVKTGGTGSQVACGYLFVRAHTNIGALQEKWEHPYIRPGEFGGHIVVSNSISDNVVDKESQILFNLSDISYRDTLASTETRKADWAALLNVTDRIRFDIALNTTNQTGVISEVSIVYKCWNPETGKEIMDCRLTVE